jgi:hypothetical protein
VDILIPYSIARNIIANRYPARDNPLGSCGSLGSYRVPGTWRTQYYIRIPDNAHMSVNHCRFIDGICYDLGGHKLAFDAVTPELRAALRRGNSKPTVDVAIDTASVTDIEQVVPGYGRLK